MNRKIALRKEMGLRLKELRMALSFTQEVMARNLGTGRPNYTRVEIGDTFLNHVILHRLAMKFNVSLDWLISGKGAMFIQNGEDWGVEKKENARAGNQTQSEEKPENPELAELLEYMAQIPFLYHDVMEFFYKFKIKHKELIDAVLGKRE